MSQQPFGLQFPQLPSALHYYLSVRYVAVSQQPSRTNPWCLQIRKLPLTLAFFFVAVLTALFHAVFFLATRDWSLSLPFQLRALHDPLRDYSPPILPLCFCIFSLLAGIALCTSLGVCGRCRIRTCGGNRIFYFCLRPLSQPSCFVCCYGIATITSPSSTP